ncbi:hypothetical protein DYBT9275_03086 [Dyadobacter sp. CECT 9275]|uniref:SGNH hydrolase-type esterase domain-containing protein n=1 Tax=Dyadobacter helix TaxID=2822344 RepID=A0A916JE91_9BACT|nr:hypothetical protein [Dyadobacter sp. CECT 9275]CAG5003180.1 hypothetical protein DYBT9275_03086 [Dyadobacter sp. CECT 9275]
MNKKRLLLFKSLALLSPVFLLAILEGGLRLFGYGHDLSLFVEDPAHPGYLVMNRYTSEKYFSRQQNATVGNFESFPRDKKKGTFRLFVLGESTTLGYPYMYNGSFHRWLQYRLMHTFPERDFEVINLSLTAVNSYTVLDFAKNIVDYQPDAVLVYTGHNEYYGALGAATTGSLGRFPFLIRLLIHFRNYRFMQLLSSAVYGIGDVFSGNKIDLRENLMKRMAAGQLITYGSKSYQAGIEQFSSNINDLCQLMSDHRIPVLISNLVSNEKDLKPLVSLKGGKDVSADFHYQAAGKWYEQGNFTEAKKEYIQARELDVLRFRAPEAMNQIIQEVAAQYKNVTWVDTKSLFESYAPHGIIGEETMLEHVHPNLYGYGLLSEAFYEGLQRSKLIPLRGGNNLSFSELRKQMPLTQLDSLKGTYEIMILKEGWPFNIPMPSVEKGVKTVEEELAGAVVVKQITWPEAMTRLQNHYAGKGDTAGVLRVTEALILNNPLDTGLCDKAAKLCLLLHEDEKAIPYLMKAFREASNFERARMLFVTLLKLDRPKEALAYIEYAAANNPSRFSLNELHSVTAQLVQVRNSFEKDSSSVELSNQLAAGYLKFANTSAAGKYITRSLQIDPRNATALKLKEQLLALQK